MQVFHNYMEYTHFLVLLYLNKFLFSFLPLAGREFLNVGVPI